jgi:micrococcal nuclease
MAGAPGHRRHQPFGRPAVVLLPPARTTESELAMTSTGPDWLPLPPRRRPRTLWSDLAGLWRGFRALPLGARLLIMAIAAVVALSVLSIVFKSTPGSNVAARSTSTLSTLPPTTTSTVPLPPGDDKTLKAVLDGDSFETTDAVKVRLVGVDAPDTETKSCFSAEAMAHLGELLGPGATVRLAYDATRTDRFGRTLAYVYRVPDGTFVNAAVVRDGFAVEQSAAPNTAHAEEIKAAADEARTARRGLWQACPTTTTAAARPSTTAAATTTTSRAPATTATSARPAATTTTTRPPTPGTVEQGAACLLPGLTAVFSNGAPAVCAVGSDGVPRWRPA